MTGTEREADEVSDPEFHPLGSVAVRLAQTKEDGVSFVVLDGREGATKHDWFYKCAVTSEADVRNAVRVAREMTRARAIDPDVLWPPTPDVAIDLDSYDHIIVTMSGGKDSLADFLYLLFLGADRKKIELWHHDIDGREGSTLMDWPCTRDYCAKLARAFDVPIYYSWKVGGFEGEMDRNNSPTNRIAFETPEGLRYTGGKGPPGTRLLFPQVSADLTVRWCSAYGKIDVGAAAIRNQERFIGKRTLFVTGERGEESTPRSKYAKLEPHRADLRYGKEPRHVDQWRAVQGWRERAVWEIIRRYGVNPHPAYRLGWGRMSCAGCIFGNENQFASLKKANPAQFEYLVLKERGTGKTIKRKESLVQLAARGTPYEMDPRDIAAALSHTFNEPMILDEWTLPRGAFGESFGPM